MVLTGSDLLAKVKEQGDASKADLVRAAGYVSTKKDSEGRQRTVELHSLL
jgi:hypothetical protein